MCFLGVGACQNFRVKTLGVGVRVASSFPAVETNLWGNFRIIFEDLITA